MAAQLFEVIAGRHSQVLISRSIVNHLQLSKQTRLQIGRDLPTALIVYEKVQ
jgi:hypothetical protein